MILTCSFEELSAVKASADRVLASAGTGGVAAPPERIADIESLFSRLQGDIVVHSLHELRVITGALEVLLNDARSRTDDFILRENPAAETAIVSYFEYAHLLTLLDRAARLADQMAALIEIMTGQQVSDESARHFSFPE